MLGVLRKCQPVSSDITQCPSCEGKGAGDRGRRGVDWPFLSSTLQTHPDTQKGEGSSPSPQQLDPWRPLRGLRCPACWSQTFYAPHFGSVEQVSATFWYTPWQGRDELR